MAWNVVEKHLEASTAYAIFFDNVRVDKYVESFDVTVTCDGSMSNANLNMMYAPDLYKIYEEDEKGNFISVKQGVEHMTNVKIFIKNVFSGKYNQVFDGNIKGKAQKRAAGGKPTMMFAAVDYLTWLNKTIVPLAIPFTKSFTSGDKIRWKAQGIDSDKVRHVGNMNDNKFAGKSINEFINLLVDKTIEANALYNEPNSVCAWDGVLDRIDIMGDIDKNLIKQQIIDFVITNSSESLNSLYVAINDVARNLMFEFYQDRDGVIRIKPPYWNERVLYDHIIDPSLILSFEENANYNNYKTRVIITGGVEEFQQELDDLSKTMVMPVGAYIGGNGTWVDYKGATGSGGTVSMNNYSATGSVKLEEDKKIVSGTEFDSYVVTSKWGKRRVKDDGTAYYHTGVDIGFGAGDPIIYRGEEAKVYKVKDTKPKYDGKEKGGYGYQVWVNVLSGPCKGTYIMYCHMTRGSSSLKEGQIIHDGQLIGKAGNTGHSHGVHLHFEVRHGDPEASSSNYDPAIYLANLNKNVSKAVSSSSNDVLLTLSDEEKLYGLSVYDLYQPLIKFSNSMVVDKENNGRDALQKYARFMYNLNNSLMETAAIQTIAMPWLRPGFNMWVDPIGIDKVYYVNSVSHFGSADGIFTTCSLSAGRERIEYAKGTSKNFFGGMRK